MARFSHVAALLALLATSALSSPPTQNVAEETASGNESVPPPAAVAAAANTIASVPAPSPPTAPSPPSAVPPPAQPLPQHELVAPAPAAPVNEAATAGAIQTKVNSVVTKVLSIIDTHTSAHDKHRIEEAKKHHPVCTHSPGQLRFCNGLSHKTYRHSAAVSFDLLDYNAHKEYRRLVEHIEYTVEEAPRADHCKAGYKEFLCAREFPHCCDIRVCGDYGPAEVAAGAQYGHAGGRVGPLVAEARSTVEDNGKVVEGTGKDATIATFSRNGTIQINQDDKADNSTVLVKLHHRPCLAYNLTYTPLFDCTTACVRTLTDECRDMLHTSCEELCAGVAHPTCATKQLLAVAHGHSGAGDRGVGVGWWWWSGAGLMMVLWVVGVWV